MNNRNLVSQFAYPWTMLLHTHTLIGFVEFSKWAPSQLPSGSIQNFQQTHRDRWRRAVEISYTDSCYGMEYGKSKS